MNVLYADGGGEERRRTGGGSSSGSLERDGRAASTIHANTTTTTTTTRRALEQEVAGVRIAHCSWCLAECAHAQVSEGFLLFRAAYRCGACARRTLPCRAPGCDGAREGRGIDRAEGRRPLPRPPRDHPGVALRCRRGIRRVDEGPPRTEGAVRVVPGRSRARSSTSILSPRRDSCGRDSCVASCVVVVANGSVVAVVIGVVLVRRMRATDGSMRDVRTIPRGGRRGREGDHAFAKAGDDRCARCLGVVYDWNAPADVNAQLTKTEPAWCGWCGERCAHLVRDKARAKCQCLVCGGGTAPCERCPGSMRTRERPVVVSSVASSVVDAVRRRIRRASGRASDAR